MMEKSDFYTIRGYQKQKEGEFTDTMEDYLEMIYRYTRKEKYIRINQLATLLNVQPPSASKMAVKLKDCGMIQFEPYGVILLTQQGEEFGAYLLYRHNTLNQLFSQIFQTENELELVEKIEHCFSRINIEKIETFLNKIE